LKHDSLSARWMRIGCTRSVKSSRREGGNRSNSSANNWARSTLVGATLVGRAGVADDARENYLNCHVNLATLLPQLSPGPGAVYGAAPEIPLYFPLPPISV
jgi:hypothetical protein